MEIRVGPAVKGSDFYGREREQRRLWEEIKAGHVLLLAPRRVGKTSLMHRLEETCSGMGFRALYMSVQGAEDERQFVERLYDQASSIGGAETRILDWRRRFLQPLLGRVQKVEVAGIGLELRDLPSDAWTTVATSLIRAVRTATGPRLLLMVDELPVFVLKLLRPDPTGQRSRAFLEWFREARQVGPGEADTIRWLIAGSIGLDTLARRIRATNTINDLSVFHLGPLLPDRADEMLGLLGTANTFQIDDATRARIIERVGWPIPYYLQLMFRQLRYHCQDCDLPASPARVDAAFEGLEPGHRTYFDAWSERLTDELGPPDDSRARLILSTCARDPAGAGQIALLSLIGTQVQDPDEILRWLLEALQTDGYLVEDQGRLRFRSPLLREYWLRKHG